MQGIDPDQLRELVIRPALQCIGKHSQAAENLVLGTMLVESSGKYLKQLGKGPALGLIQMEPATHDDIWNNYLKTRHKLRKAVEELCTSSEISEGALELVGNLFYAAAMCRIQYLRKQPPLPAVDDAVGMAAYWKQHYNTTAGEGTLERALPYFLKACA